MGFNQVWNTTFIWANLVVWYSLECSSSQFCGVDEEGVSEEEIIDQIVLIPWSHRNIHCYHQWISASKTNFVNLWLNLKARKYLFSRCTVANAWMFLSARFLSHQTRDNLVLSTGLQSLHL